MATQTSWYIKDRVVLCRVDGNFTLDEIKQASDEIKSLLEQGRRPVHVISDVRELKEYPIRLGDIKNSTEYLRHPAMGWQIVVSHQNQLIRFLATVLGQAVHVNIRVVSTMEEATAVLERIDQGLGEMQSGTA